MNHMGDFNNALIVGETRPASEIGSSLAHTYI